MNIENHQIWLLVKDELFFFHPMKDIWYEMFKNVNQQTQR